MQKYEDSTYFKYNGDSKRLLADAARDERLSGNSSKFNKRRETLISSLSKSNILTDGRAIILGQNPYPNINWSRPFTQWNDVLDWINDRGITCSLINHVIISKNHNKVYIIGNKGLEPIAGFYYLIVGDVINKFIRGSV